MESPAPTPAAVPSIQSRSGAWYPLPSTEALRRLRSLGVRAVPVYVWCTIFTAFGGFLWGFDTGSIGPVTIMPQFETQFKTITPTVQGLIVSSILLTASISSFGAGPLADHISRTLTIAIGGGIFALGSAMACAAYTLPQLFIGRCIAGVGEGLFASVITVYVTEIAPTSSRGRLANTMQLYNVIGLCSGYFVCYGAVKVPSSFSWRLPFALQAFVGTALAIGTPFLPHSPRWLKQVGRHAEVEPAWIKLGVNRVEAEKEEELIQREAAAAEGSAKAPWYKQAQQLWTKDVRGRTILGLFVMATQQTSGIDAVLYYAPILFAQAGLSSTKSSFLASGVSGLLNIAFAIVGQAFADKWGRRASMIWGGTLITTTMLLMGTLYATAANKTPAGGWAIVVLIYIFVIGFVTSWAMACRIVCSEIQPMKTRAAAASLGQCVNWAVNWVIAFSTPLFLQRSNSGPYFLFGGCSLMTVLVCAAFQPETKGLSLEDMDEGFGTSPWRMALDKMRPRRVSDASSEQGNVELSEMETSAVEDTQM